MEEARDEPAAVAAPPWPPPAGRRPLFGREADLAALAALLLDGNDGAGRSLSIVGPPGAGKSRLAAELCHRLPPGAFDDVWWIDVAEVVGAPSAGQDPERPELPERPDDAARAADVLAEVAAARAGLSFVRDAAGLARALRRRRVLLAFDNAEHARRPLAALLGALAATGHRGVLIASRIPIGAPGERVWTTAGLGPDPAVALFLHCWLRTGTTMADEQGEAHRVAVAELCRRVGGNPLAIALVAARCRTFTPDGLVALLDGPAPAPSLLDVAGAVHGEPPGARHTTMRACLVDSHELLADAERAVLRRLAVCRGSFDARAAIAIAGDGGIDAGPVLDALERLTAQSLLVADVRSAADAPDRFRLPELVRDFALERLAASGEARLAQQRHAAWYGGPGWWEPGGCAAAPRFETLLAQGRADHANLVAAVEDLLASGDRAAAATTVCRSTALWVGIGARRAASIFLTRAAAGPLEPHQRRSVLLARAQLARAANDLAATIRLGMEVVETDDRERFAGDELGIEARLLVAPPLCWAGDERGPRLLGEATEAARHAGLRSLLAEALIQQAADALLVRERTALAAPSLDEAERLMGDSDGRSASLLLYRAIEADQRGAVAATTDLLDRLLAGPGRTTGLGAAAIMVRTRAARLAGRSVPDRSELAKRHRLAVDSGAELDAAHFGVAEISAALVEGDPEGAAELGDRLAGRLAASGMVPLAVNARGDAIEAWCRLGDGPRLSAAVAALREAAAAIGARTFVERAELIELWQRLGAGDVAGAGAISTSLVARAEPRVRAGLAADVLDGVTILLEARGHHARAVRVAGAVHRAHAQLGQRTRREPYAGAVTAALTRCRRQLGTEAFAAEWAAGQAMDLEGALGAVRVGRRRGAAAAFGWAALTDAELAVAAAVAGGRTNPQIAEALCS